MKKKTLMMITILFGISLIIFACRREFANYAKDKPKVSADYLASAKDYNSRVVAQTTPFISKIKGARYLKPNWKESWMLNSPEGFQLMIVPTTQSRVSDPTIEIRRVFVFTFLDDVVASGNILELVGNNYSVMKNLDFVLANYRRPVIEGFNGAIIQYDLAYRWTSGNSFLNGKRETDTVSLVKKMIKKGDAEKKLGLYLKSIPAGKTIDGAEFRIKFLNRPGGDPDSSKVENVRKSKELELIGTPGNGVAEGVTDEIEYGGNTNVANITNTAPDVETVTSGGYSAYICGGYRMAKTGLAYNASLSDLGFVMYVKPQGEQPIEILCIWNYACVTVPFNSAATDTESKCSALFQASYNTALDDTIAGVKSGSIPYMGVSIQAAFKALILAKMKFVHYGCAMSTGSACLNIQPVKPLYCVLKPCFIFNTTNQILAA